MLQAIQQYMRGVRSPEKARKGLFYRRSLAWILTATAIPGLLIGAIMYWLGDSRMEQQLLSLHNNQIEKRAQNIDEQLSYMEQSLSHWAFDSRFNYELKDKDFFRDFEDAWDISKALLIMKGADPLASRVELYLEGPPQIVFKPEYQYVGPSDNLLEYNRLLKNGRTVYWTEWTDSSSTDAPVQELTLVHKIPGDSLDPFGILLIHLNQEKMNRLLKTLTPYDQGDTFLITDQGRLILSSGGGAKPTPFEDALKLEVSKRGVAQGSFLFPWGKSTYTVSFGTMPRMGENWLYVSAAPTDVITAPVMILSKLVLTASVVVLLFALALAWFASRRIYSPLGELVRRLAGDRAPLAEGAHRDELRLIEEHWHHLTRESSTLQNRLEEQLPYVQEGFLLQFVQGYLSAYTERDLLDRMKHYGWVVENRQFIVLHIQLTGLSNLEGRFSHDDEGLVTFAAANIIQELASGCFEQAEAINFHDLSIGLLVIEPAGRSCREELIAFGEEATLAISRILRLQVTVTLGRSTGHIREVPELFESAVQAVNYRTFENQNQIIDMEQLEAEEESEEPHYPFGLERDIVQKLRTGQQQEAERLVAEFIQTVSANNAKDIEVQQAMLQLLGSVQHAIRHAGIRPTRLFRGANLYEQLSQIRDSQQMRKWFSRKVITPYMQELEARSDHHLKKMIEGVMIELQEHYMTDISLDHCAERTGTNPYFLSRTFKQVTGKNFIDYLTELRMDKAKELLRDTDLKINEIAVRVGYQYTYFNRIFKKQEGVTPSQYRELGRPSE